MTHIARYIDDPPQIFLWDIDDIILFSIFFGAGILTGLITTCGIVGCGMVYILMKVKKTKSEGFFLHMICWNVFFALRGVPRSYLRYFIE
jgi:type IV conjugative transfer system protein TraL